jgi:hypothetical protein
MALSDILLKQLSKNANKVSTKGEHPEGATNKLKSKAALIISVFAAIFSVNAFIQSQLASTILNNTIHANDVYSFYQAKSIKQNLAEMQLDDAVDRKETAKAAALKAKIDRYESDPATGEGKRELLAKAKHIEAERDLAKKKAPWIGIAGSIMQIAIVLLTASILSTGAMMFWAGLAAQTVAMVIMSHGLFLWLPV